MGANYNGLMRIISKRTLREFWEIPKYSDSKGPLESWYQEAEGADWPDPHVIKAKYKNASILKNNTVVFNIHGNTYRLVVRINYKHRMVYIRFIGTHKQYDDIDAENI